MFRTRLNPDTIDEYLVVSERITALAVAMPGYIEHKTFFAEDGEQLTIVEFADAVTEKAWSEHPEHLAVKQRGRDTYYLDYNLKVCTVDYESTSPDPT